MNLALDRRPLIVALAGPNGAGKTTFYHAHLQPAGLRFVNADVLAQDLHIEPYAAARVVDAVRHELVKQRESFVFETVFSDPSARSSPSSRAWSKRATTRFCALSGLPDRRCANNALRCGSRRADTMFLPRSWSSVFRGSWPICRRQSANSRMFWSSTITTCECPTAWLPSLKVVVW